MGDNDSEIVYGPDDTKVIGLNPARDGFKITDLTTQSVQVLVVNHGSRLRDLLSLENSLTKGEIATMFSTVFNS